MMNGLIVPILLVLQMTLMSSQETHITALDETPSLYLVLGDDHSKVIGTISNGDTILRTNNANSSFYHENEVYKTLSTSIYRNNEVIGLLVRCVNENSEFGMTAYYGIDILDENGIEVFATACDDKHICFGINCRSCRLKITNCIGSCECETSDELPITTKQYCEHFVSSGTEAHPDDNSVFQWISRSSISWNNVR